LARVSIFLVRVALIAGMIGCGGGVVEYDLTITSTAGGSVTTPGEDTYTYDEGEIVDLVAEAEEGYRFVNWTGDVDSIVDVEDATTTVTMNDNYSITANFVKQYDLTISSTEGGEVTNPGEETFTCDEGEVVNLVAEAEEGYHFVNWTGDVGTIADVEDATTTITMNGDYTITANFAIDLYFWTDAWAFLKGPAALPPEERDPCVSLGITTNMVVDRVRVDMPDGRSAIVPAYTEYTDVVSPGVNGTTVLHFFTCEPGMPIAGGEYIFTALDAAGEPIPGVRNTDIWVGVEPPAPPTNVRAELTEDGILVSWDESPIIPGSFEPEAEPRLGFYKLDIGRFGAWELVYEANSISVSYYLIPKDKADFIEGKDYGLSLGEMEDGTYSIACGLHSIAPEGSLGKGMEYFISDPGQNIAFTIQDGEITIYGH